MKYLNLQQLVVFALVFSCFSQSLFSQGFIGNRVWDDADRNGIFDCDEAGIPGVTVNLLNLGPDGIAFTSDDVIEQTTVTDANGQYLFSGVKSNIYRITFVSSMIGSGSNQYVYTQLGDFMNAVDRDSDVDFFGNTYFFSFDENKNDFTRDAGMYKSVPPIAPTSTENILFENMDMETIMAAIANNASGGVAALAPVCPYTSIVAEDPCSCSDIQNILGADGRPIFLHDVLTVTSTPNQTSLEIVNFFPPDNPLTTPIALVETPIGSGVYKADFFHIPDHPTILTISDDGGLTIEEFTTSVCNAEVCFKTRIPTMSEWGTLIFGLLILNLGLFFIKSKEMQEDKILS